MEKSFVHLAIIPVLGRQQLAEVVSAHCLRICGFEAQFSMWRLLAFDWTIMLLLCEILGCVDRISLNRNIMLGELVSVFFKITPCDWLINTTNLHLDHLPFIIDVFWAGHSRSFATLMLLTV